MSLALLAGVFGLCVSIEFVVTPRCYECEGLPLPDRRLSPTSYWCSPVI